MISRRPRRNEAQPAPCLEDIRTASAWGLNLHQWQALTDTERAEYRRTITTAPRFVA